MRECMARSVRKAHLLAVVVPQPRPPGELSEFEHVRLGLLLGEQTGAAAGVADLGGGEGEKRVMGGKKGRRGEKEW